MRRTAAVWQCHRNGYPLQAVRFIPAAPDSTRDQSSAIEVRGIIACGIKRIMDKQDPKARNGDHGSLVPYPEILVSSASH